MGRAADALRFDAQGDRARPGLPAALRHVPRPGLPVHAAAGGGGAAPAGRASRAPDYWPAHLFLAAAYGHLGRPDEAAAALVAVRRQTRLASLRDADPADDYRAGLEKDYFLQGLALAGLSRE